MTAFQPKWVSMYARSQFLRGRTGKPRSAGCFDSNLLWPRRRASGWSCAAHRRSPRGEGSTDRISFRRKTTQLALGDIAAAEIEALPGQDGGDVTIGNHPFTVVPGFPAVVAKSKQMRFNDYGLKWEVSNKTGFFSPVADQSA
jgi:hypothetical protein